MPIQQMLLGAGGAVATKTYVDDVFNTFLYTGNATARSINTGVDMTEGGLVWIKNRDTAYNHFLTDTERGAGKEVLSSDSSAELTSTSRLTSFGSSGFSLGNDDEYVNASNQDFASWTFRKAPGFFDVVTYTGNGVDGRSISHSLGCIPGMWMVKRTDGTGSWIVGHSRMLGGTGDDYKWHVYLNTNDDKDVNGEFTYNSPPTATTLSLGSSSSVNGDGNEYVAYLFAGGESTAATARSVEFDGSGDYLLTSSSSDFTFGTGDFTVEHWVNADNFTNQYQQIIDFRMNGEGYATNWCTYITTDGTYRFFANGDKITSSALSDNTWYHVAVVRNSGTTTLYLNGVSQGTYSDSNDYDNTQITIGINGTNRSSSDFNGKISNVRVVKGTAVYTSAFKPPTEPLTSVTNTKLLCCNNSSVTGTTVGTVTSGGNPTASSDSPFDDPAGFVFGDAEDQNVIKCGSYKGNNNANGPEVFLGFEPQFIILKESSDSGNHWRMYDSMRGMVTGGDDAELYPSSNIEEDPANEFLELTPTGFKLKTSDSAVNDNQTYIYMCIRRPDGYVGKPPSLGTGVFNMPLGLTDGTKPAFNTGFPVDFLIYKKPASTGDWYTGARLIGGKSLKANNTAAEGSNPNIQWDVQDGMGGWSGLSSGYQSWGFKRHAGFDVVTYKGDDVSGRQIPHSLNKTIEMMWIKNRDSAREWVVYHKGLNGGTNPQNYHLHLDGSAAESASSSQFNNTAPTSSHFTVGNDGDTNLDGDNIIAMLFASVDGISKVGYYDGSSTSSAQTITTGFQPRFLMIKRINASGSSSAWINVDTTRGWVSGDDKVNYFNLTVASEEYNMGYPISTGFVLDVDASFNMANNKYIYYAHA